MSEGFIWSVIIGMAVLNFAVRFVPIAIVSRVELPPAAVRWLSFVPISVMGALVALGVLRPDGDFAAPWASPHVAGAIVTALVYRFTRSFLGATIAGMLTFVVLRQSLGVG